MATTRYEDIFMTMDHGLYYDSEFPGYSKSFLWNYPKLYIDSVTFYNDQYHFKSGSEPA